MRKFGMVWSAGAAACALLLAACVDAPRTGPQAGVAAKTSGRPSVVSLNPCTDAILAEVAVPEQILALSHYSHDPRSSSMPAKEAAKFAVTGGTAEEVLALEPDVVIAGSFIAPSTRLAFERLGIRVSTFGSPKSLEESQGQVREIARLVGDPTLGAALRRAMEQSQSPQSGRQAGMRPGSKRNGGGPSALLWQPGQIVAGRDQLVSQMMRESGFASHAEAMGLDQADHASLEMIVANPPDILFLAGESQGQLHPSLARVSDMSVSRLDPQHFYCAGPSIIRLRSALAAVRARPMK